MYGEFPRSETLHRTLSTQSGTGEELFTTTAFPKTWVNTRWGTSVPKWKQKITLGASAMSSFNATLVDVQASDAQGTIEYFTTKTKVPASYRKRTISGALQDIAVPDLDFPSDMTGETETKARERFYNTLRKKQNGFRSGVFLGELAETLHMVRNPGRNLYQGIQRWHDFVTKNVRRVAKTPNARNKFLSQTWLEASYGWAPLISDVKSGYEALEKRKRWLERNILTVAPMASEAVDTVATERTNLGTFPFEYVERNTMTVSVRYYGALANTALNNTIPDAQYWGFDPTDLVPTVWELVPYSFLIDYFSNMGDMLNGWSLRNIHVTWAGRTERREKINSLENVRTRKLDEDYVQLQNYVVASNQRITSKMVSRTEVQNVPVPGIRFEIPGLSSKWINIGALARQKSSWKFFFH